MRIAEVPISDSGGHPEGEGTNGSVNRRSQGGRRRTRFPRRGISAERAGRSHRRSRQVRPRSRLAPPPCHHPGGRRPGPAPSQQRGSPPPGLPGPLLPAAGRSLPQALPVASAACRPGSWRCRRRSDRSRCIYGYYGGYYQKAGPPSRASAGKQRRPGIERADVAVGGSKGHGTAEASRLGNPQLSVRRGCDPATMRTVVRSTVPGRRIIGWT